MIMKIQVTYILLLLRLILPVLLIIPCLMSLILILQLPTGKVPVNLSNISLQTIFLIVNFHNHKAFTSKIINLFVPRNIQEVLNDLNWKLAVMEEMNSTWDILELRKEKKTVGCKWMFTLKCKADGSVERYKVGLVAEGFTQTYGVDYQETFATVVKINSIRNLLSVVANFDWPLYQLDVKNVFLNGELKEEVIMDLPPSFKVDLGINKVCKLKRSLYGLKQSPRA